MIAVDFIGPGDVSGHGFSRAEKLVVEPLPCCRRHARSEAERTEKVYINPEDALVVRAAKISGNLRKQWAKLHPVGGTSRLVRGDFHQSPAVSFCQRPKGQSRILE